MAPWLCLRTVLIRSRLLDGRSRQHALQHTTERDVEAQLRSADAARPTCADSCALPPPQRIQVRSHLYFTFGHAKARVGDLHAHLAAEGGPPRRVHSDGARGRVGHGVEEEVNNHLIEARAVREHVRHGHGAVHVEHDAARRERAHLRHRVVDLCHEVLLHDAHRLVHTLARAAPIVQGQLAARSGAMWHGGGRTEGAGGERGAPGRGG